MLMKYAFLCTLVSSAAFAVDGVILIDQNRALAGGITPGDAPGFPVTITQPGSYRLSGKLTAPAGVNGIEIGASGVTLDLNGFSIEGPAATCGFPCPQAITLSGSQQAIAVRNGITLGFSGSIDLNQASFLLIEGLIAQQGVLGVNGFLAIGPNSVMRNTTAAIRIYLNCPVAVSSVATTVAFTRIGSNPNSCNFNNTIGTIQ